MTADALLTRVAVALHGVTPPDPEGALALHRDAAARVVAALGDEGLRSAVAHAEAILNEWMRRAGPESDAWRVYGPQTLSVPYAVKTLRKALTTEPTP